MVELIERRRLIMECPSDYVRDGLIFFLDGLNRGGVSGKWTDVVGGKTFDLVGGYVEHDSYVHFGNSSYGVYDWAISDNFDGETGEFVLSGLSDSTTGQGIFLQPITDGKVGYSVYHRGGNWWFEINGARHIPYVVQTGATSKTTISTQGYTNALGVQNAQEIPRNGNSNYWNGNSTGKTYLAARVISAAPYQFYEGGVYAVRIYNRKLTRAEVLNNQRLDNIRYNLGLNLD